MIGKRDYVKIISNHRNKFLKKHKVSDKDNQREVVTGCEDFDYLFLIDYFLTHQPKCVVEYGSGYTTWLMHELVNDYKLDTYIISHENEKQYFDWILSNIHVPRELINLTPIHPLPELNFDGFTVCRYNDKPETYPDVDLVITDGPGPTPLGNFNVTNNYLEICKVQNRKIPHWIDGRKYTKKYYIELGYGEQILHQ